MKKDSLNSWVKSGTPWIWMNAGAVSIAVIMTLGLLAIIAGCAADSKFKTYNGPPVTQIVVNKSARQMLFLSGNTVIKSYNVGLGNEPRGHKQFSGDGKTPEGLYYIDRRNPDSRYHL